MTLELITFIAAILFGALLYWRESQRNTLYRIFNKIIYSKALQIKATETKGFLYQQKFIVRFMSLGTLILLGIVITRFLVPISIATLSLFMSMLVGMLAGTYLAGFIFESGKIIEAKSEVLEDLVQDSLEQGKEFLTELKPKKEKLVQKEDVLEKEAPTAAPEKSARERLKDKGLL